MTLGAELGKLQGLSLGVSPAKAKVHAVSAMLQGNLVNTGYKLTPLSQRDCDACIFLPTETDSLPPARLSLSLYTYMSVNLCIETYRDICVSCVYNYISMYIKYV